MVTKDAQPAATKVPLSTATKTTCLSCTATDPVGTKDAANQYAIPVGQTEFKLTALRDAWPSTGADVVKVRADISLDGGKTWRLLIAFTSKGGATLDRNGQLSTESWASIGLPEPDNPNRVVSVTMETLTQLKTSVSVEVK